MYPMRPGTATGRPGHIKHINRLARNGFRPGGMEESPLA